MADLTSGERARMAGELMLALGIGTGGGALLGAGAGLGNPASVIAAGVNMSQDEPVLEQWRNTIGQAAQYGAVGGLLGAATGYGVGRHRRNGANEIQNHIDALTAKNALPIHGLLGDTGVGATSGAALGGAIPIIGGLVNSFGQYQPVTASTPYA